MIGIFDSGVGGLSVWQRLKQELPGASTMYLADSAFAPYGEKSAAQIVERSKQVVRTLVEHGAKMVVVAQQRQELQLESSQNASGRR